jgi:hypothetical protein
MVGLAFHRLNSFGGVSSGWVGRGVVRYGGVSSGWARPGQEGLAMSW